MPEQVMPQWPARKELAKYGHVYPADESAGLLGLDPGMTYASEASTFVSSIDIGATRHLLTPPSSHPCRPNIAGICRTANRVSLRNISPSQQTALRTRKPAPRLPNYRC